MRKTYPQAEAERRAALLAYNRGVSVRGRHVVYPIGRPPRETPLAKCRVRGCRDIVDTHRGGARGMCATHYQRERRRLQAAAIKKMPRAR